MQILLSHNWPGNVRELENAIEHAVTVAKSDTVTPADLPAYLIESMGAKDTVVSFNLEGKDTIDFPTVVQQVEKKLIHWALAKCDGNQAHAADLLKIPRSTLRDKISKIEPEH
jgi:transcriptional regulator with PAS, ATPase and Fis domain